VALFKNKQAVEKNSLQPVTYGHEDVLSKILAMSGPHFFFALVATRGNFPGSWRR
jgi:hypothetical protein